MHDLDIGTLPVSRFTWFDRNWKWSVPLVAVTACLLLGVFVLAVLAFVEFLMGSSYPYKMACRKRSSPSRLWRALAGLSKSNGLVRGNYTSGRGLETSTSAFRFRASKEPVTSSLRSGGDTLANEIDDRLRGGPGKENFGDSSLL